MIALTGIGSVGPRGLLAGPAPGSAPDPCPITRWPAESGDMARLAPPFRIADALPGVNTRRMDRLSAWCLASMALALKDAGREASSFDPAAVAVVSATGLGCLDLTEAYFRSARDHGWDQTDPMLFPETLGNAPAGHAARIFRFKGPNITIGSTSSAGEAALVTACSLLKRGRAQAALVLAGDLLTRPRHEFHKAAGDLERFVPSEGVAAALLEADSNSARARIRTASWARSEPGSPIEDSIADGLPDTGALFRLQTALAASRTIHLCGAHATVVLEVGA